MPLLMQIILILIGLYLLSVLGLFFYQRKLMYHPERRLITPHINETFPFETVALKTADGLSLKAAYKTPTDSTFPTVVYFHGNTGIIEDAMHKLVPIANAGYGILMPEYRGYGGNAGSPSESGLLLDAEAALNFIYEKQGDDTPVIYYGMSMGTGVANALAEKVPPAGLIQEGGFTTMTAVAKKHHPYWPIKGLIRDSFDSKRRIGSLTAPLLVLHGEKDRTVPVEHGKEMYDTAQSDNRTIKIYPDGHHIDLFDFGSSDDILVWLNKNYRSGKE